MATPARIAANKRNARKSTGPSTPGGVLVSRMNALAHGLRAAAPVIPGEDPRAWEQFRDAALADLAPVGLIEAELADRAAALLWRLRRVTAYEAGVITRTADRGCRRVRGELAGPDAVFEDGTPAYRDDDQTVAGLRRRIAAAEQSARRWERLAGLYAGLRTAAPDARYSGADALELLAALTEFLPDDPDASRKEEDGDGTPFLAPLRDARHTRFQLELGIPYDQHDEPEGWDGWTAGVIRVGVGRVARSAKWPVKWTPAKLLGRAVRESAAALEAERAKLADLRRQLAEAERAASLAEAEVRRRAAVSATAAEVVMKYEGHLHRQLAAALHELERRQAVRSADPPRPPVSVDVTVHAPPELAERLVPIEG